MQNYELWEFVEPDTRRSACEDLFRIEELTLKQFDVIMFGVIFIFNRTSPCPAGPGRPGGPGRSGLGRPDRAGAAWPGRPVGQGHGREGDGVADPRTPH